MIARFVDRSWLLVGELERAQYFSRLTAALARAEWTLLGYALMSSHVHILAEAGATPLSAWAKPLHVGMAQWLNRRCGRLGPVFADRPYCEIVEPSAISIVLAYLHNNPVRARVVKHAAESSWTSHRAYIGLDPEPTGLDVRRGLGTAGFATDSKGRMAFDAWVQECAIAQTQGVVARAEVSRLVRACRERVGSSVHLGTATRDRERATFPLLASADALFREPRDFCASEIITAVTEASGVRPNQASRLRPKRLATARRAALVLWSHTGRPRSIMVRALGIASSTATRLAQTASPDDVALNVVVERARNLLKQH